ncbi:MAG: glycosyltransferase family 4 protein [Candidatus Woesearchaeota archaeon]|nr:MAG: glycosyltransferase family 4 protein [Candidatus Woesearchaeota archaeon]
MVKICYVNPTVLMKRPIAQISSMFGKDKNFKISILTPRLAFKKRDDSLYYSKLEGVKVIAYPCINPPMKSEWPIPSLDFFKKSWNILKNNDILHMWVPFYFSNTWIIILKNLFFRNKKLILTMDTIPSYSFKMGGIMDVFFKFYFKVIAKLIFRGVDYVTVYGDSFIKYAKEAGIPERKIVITPTGINFKLKDKDKDIRKEFNICKDEKIILFVGLLVPRKGVDIVLKTIKKFREDKIRCVLVGDGPCRKEYEDLVKKLKIEDKVVFTGFRKDIHNFYHEASVFFFPSRGEGLAGVIMEAAVYKIPIVSSKIPGTLDLIDDGKTGYLCMVEDINQYHKKIKELLNDKKIRLKFIKKEYYKINKNYSWKDNFKKLKELY